MSEEKNQKLRTCEWCDKGKDKHIEVFKIWGVDGVMEQLCRDHLQRWLSAGHKPKSITVISGEKPHSTDWHIVVGQSSNDCPHRRYYKVGDTFLCGVLLGLSYGIVHGVLQTEGKLPKVDPSKVKGFECRYENCTSLG